jgi:outer membrane protein assembly factor BamD (BamD/ComL family)
MSPVRALELVRQHTALYPNSTFEEEREVLAIEAERRLGETAAAAARARRFLQAHPSSIHRPEVEQNARGE